MSRQPPAGTQIDLNNPITEGLVSSFNAGHIINPQQTSAIVGINASTGDAINRKGRAVEFANSAGQYAIIGDGDMFDIAATIFYIRRPTDATLRQTTGFGVRDAGGVGATKPWRLGSHMPWVDGTVYWDFAGNDAGQRRTWAGYSKNVAQVDEFCFHAGPAGGAIWYNGEKVQSDAIASSARDNNQTDNNWYLNDGSGVTEADAAEVNLFLAWTRQLSDIEIHSLYENPWQVFKPQRYLIPLTGERVYVVQEGAATTVIITDVDGNETWIDGATGLVIAGSGFV